MRGARFRASDLGDDLALHVECQGYHDASFPERLARYQMAAALRYPRRHVRTIALWVIRPPDRHRLEEVELTGVRVSVTAVVLPEIPAELLLRDPRAACFAIGADPGRWSDEELGQRVAHALRQHGASERELALAVALSLTAGRYDAMVNAMKESELGSVVLEEFVRFGEDRGELRMARQNVLDVLAARGLAADEDTLHRIQQETSVERLRVLLRRAAVAATPTELFDPGDAPP